MIKEVVGDLLLSHADILAHQVNCVGVMGAGVAKQFRDKLLSAGEFSKYVSLCKSLGNSNLGKVQILDLTNGKYLANLFGENIPTGTEVDTNYAALEEALTTLKDIAEKSNLSIALPGYMGCGLAGGDWDIVFDMIERVFIDSTVSVEVVYHPTNVIDEICTLTGEEELFEFTYPIFRPCTMWKRRYEAITYIAETRCLCGKYDFHFRGEISKRPYYVTWCGEFLNGKPTQWGARKNVR